MAKFLIQSRSFHQLVSVGAACALLGLTGCGSVAPSKTVSGAGTGAAVGGLGGAVVGNNSSMGSGAGIAAGAAAGALVGGVIGMINDAKDRREQDRLAQERAYMQEQAKRRADEAKAKAAMEEELAIAQGFKISDLELNEHKRKLEEASERLKRLQAERNAALARKKELDETIEKTAAAEAEAARLEEELARLKGEEIEALRRQDTGVNDSASAPGQPAAPVAGAPSVKPGT